MRSPARQQLSPRAVHRVLGLGPGQESPAKSCKTPGPSLAGAAPGGAPRVKASPGHRDALGRGGLGTHREGVIDVEGDLPLLEGELLLAVPAHRHQPRHRRRFLLPAAEPASSPETPRR